MFELVNGFTWWHGHQRHDVSAEVGDALTDRYWTYASALFAAVEAARRGVGREAFVRRHLSPFWTFVVRRC